MEFLWSHAVRSSRELFLFLILLPSTTMVSEKRCNSCTVRKRLSYLSGGHLKRRVERGANFPPCFAQSELKQKNLKQTAWVMLNLLIFNAYGIN